ncbi:GNAT family N-acetyltransferase [Methylomonas sp. AM2-LC]|uniref:GNAT family N-acetyltransferase n=1 Tax=Methylomonas sp. AM2-LC TaxID=3153301 RepID=UPI0032648300
MLMIRPAQLIDIPFLCNLLHDLFSLESEFTPDHFLQNLGLAKIIANPELGVILLAQRQNSIVGMVNLLFTVSTALGGRVALLEDMVVSEVERNHGLGTQLLEAAILFAKQQGCQRITLLTDQVNQDAQRFYARQGFKLSGMVPMRLDLGAG